MGIKKIFRKQRLLPIRKYEVYKLCKSIERFTTRTIYKKISSTITQESLQEIGIKRSVGLYVSTFPVHLSKVNISIEPMLYTVRVKGDISV